MKSSESDPLPPLNRSWITAQRGPRNPVSADLPYAAITELERNPIGIAEPVLTVFLTNRECPFQCLMCDLWQNTTEQSVAVGSIPKQIQWALAQHESTPTIKLYNSGNFFDRRAIPHQDWPEIADLVRSHSRVIVECHPRLVNADVLRFQDLIPGQLEIAMGLETADPHNLKRLNKGMTLEDFANACRFLFHHNIDIRAFILIKTPFQTEQEGILWSQASLDYAFDCGVHCCAVIPTRTGNGAMEALETAGHFCPPTMASIEAVFEYGLSLGRGRVFLDPWDLEDRFSCQTCQPQRMQRLLQANLEQQMARPIRCNACEP